MHVLYHKRLHPQSFAVHFQSVELGSLQHIWYFLVYPYLNYPVYAETLIVTVTSILWSVQFILAVPMDKTTHKSWHHTVDTTNGMVYTACLQLSDCFPTISFQKYLQPAGTFWQNVRQPVCLTERQTELPADGTVCHLQAISNAWETSNKVLLSYSYRSIFTLWNTCQNINCTLFARLLFAFCNAMFLHHARA